MGQKTKNNDNKKRRRRKKEIQSECENISALLKQEISTHQPTLIHVSNKSIIDKSHSFSIPFYALFSHVRASLSCLTSERVKRRKHTHAHTCRQDWWNFLHRGGKSLINAQAHKLWRKLIVCFVLKPKVPVLDSVSVEKSSKSRRGLWILIRSRISWTLMRLSQQKLCVGLWGSHLVLNSDSETVS